MGESLSFSCSRHVLALVLVLVKQTWRRGALVPGWALGLGMGMGR